LKKRCNAVTLLEVLVCISIIAILVALMLPTFRGANIKAQETVSVANMRQIVVAYRLYHDDCEAFPPTDTIYYPGLKTYFAGTPPRPPLASGPPPGMPEYDLDTPYETHVATAFPLVTELDRQCIRERGDAWPLVRDPNFADSIKVGRRAAAVLLYMRLDGSAERMDALSYSRRFTIQPWTLPCPGASEYANYP